MLLDELHEPLVDLLPLLVHADRAQLAGGNFDVEVQSRLCPTSTIVQGRGAPSGLFALRRFRGTLLQADQKPRDFIDGALGGRQPHPLGTAGAQRIEPLQ